MEMTQIRYFLALRHEGSFTRAAGRCGVAQPSLTRAIRNLESELGTTLFDRNPAGATLTASGQRIAPYLNVIWRCVSEVKSERWRRGNSRSTQDVMQMLGDSLQTSGLSSDHRQSSTRASRNESFG
ncbi:MAG TPA: LysR family transcriptional regulator [Pseudolabrys sp.]|nr:LysR family transcriptional regulator [Pseudolabrys sp.]